jgi:DNA-binding NtrC family response regulator
MPSPKSIPTILWIDNDIQFIEDIEKKFNNHYLIIKAQHFNTALEILRSHPPELIITEWILPDEQKEKIIYSLKDMIKHIPVIIVSSHNESRDIVKAIKAGVQDYITKPVSNAQDLLEIINNTSESIATFNKTFFNHDSPKIMNQQ